MCCVRWRPTSTRRRRPASARRRCAARDGLAGGARARVGAEGRADHRISAAGRASPAWRSPWHCRERRSAWWRASGRRCEFLRRLCAGGGARERTRDPVRARGAVERRPRVRRRGGWRARWPRSPWCSSTRRRCFAWEGRFVDWRGRRERRPSRRATRRRRLGLRREQVRKVHPFPGATTAICTCS